LLRRRASRSAAAGEPTSDQSRISALGASAVTSNFAGQVASPAIRFGAIEWLRIFEDEQRIVAAGELELARVTVPTVGCGDIVPFSERTGHGHLGSGLVGASATPSDLLLHQHATGLYFDADYVDLTLFPGNARVPELGTLLERKWPCRAAAPAR